MGKQIRWTSEACDWLERVYSYVELENPRAARGLVKDIIQKTKLLEKFPEMGQHLFEFPERDIRVLLYGHYRIVYLIKNPELIDILGIFHGALDIKKYLSFE